MKSTKIKDLISSLEYEPDTLFTILLIEKNKSGKLSPREFREVIASMLLDKFLDFFYYIKKDTV